MPCHPLIAEIDLSAVAHNLRQLRALIGPRRKLCAVVKADAYGHGVATVLPALEDENVSMLAVATIAEARQLRELGWHKPVLLLGTELNVYDGPERHDLAQWLVENRIDVTVFCREDADCVADAARGVGVPANLHLMLDSGMSSTGGSEAQLRDVLQWTCGHLDVHVAGLYTHFAGADEFDLHAADVQLERFDAFVRWVLPRLEHQPIVHAANSAATARLPASWYDMIRPGLSVYGLCPCDAVSSELDLRPVLELRSHLSAVKQVATGSAIGYGGTFVAPREMTIGLVPIGYADGYDRRLTNRGRVLVADCAVDVVGRVAMDMTAIDLTELVHDGVRVRTGDPVVVISRQPTAANSVDAISRQLDAIPYEVTTGLGQRVRRVPSPQTHVKRRAPRHAVRHRIPPITSPASQPTITTPSPMDR